MTKRSTGKFAVGAAIGAVVGVIAGILTAPKSGKETRADIKKNADKVVKETKAKAQGVAKDIKKKANEVKKSAEAAINRSSEEDTTKNERK